MAEEKKTSTKADAKSEKTAKAAKSKDKKKSNCLLYTSPSPRDA